MAKHIRHLLRCFFVLAVCLAVFFLERADETAGGGKNGCYGAGVCLYVIDGR